MEQCSVSLLTSLQMSRIYDEINLISYELKVSCMIAIICFINKNQVFNRNCEKNYAMPKVKKINLSWNRHEVIFC